MNDIDEGHGLLSQQAIHRITGTEDIQMEIIDFHLSESLKKAEKFNEICILNESLASNVKDLEAAELVQDGMGQELAVAHQEIEELEEELRIEKQRSAKLEMLLNQCKWQPEAVEHSNVTQLRLE